MTHIWQENIYYQKKKPVALIVDDDLITRSAGRLILSAAGLNVLTADNGSRAVEMFDKAADDIDLVITDMQMPRMNGDEARERIKEIDPDTPVILLSGEYSPEYEERFDRVLKKPVQYDQLLGTVQEVL